jgi:hypothetical protein
VTETEREAEREVDREEEPSSLQKHTLEDLKEIVVEREKMKEREEVTEGAAEMKEGAEAGDVLQAKTKASGESNGAGDGEAMMEGVSETKDSEAGSAGRATSPSPPPSLCCYHALECCYWVLRLH